MTASAFLGHTSYTGGFAKINSMVFEQYRDWVISVAMDASENYIEDLERLLVCCIGTGKK
jgi:hypothetical protein